MENILSFLIQDAVAQQGGGGSEMGLMNVIIPILLIIAIIVIVVKFSKRMSTTSEFGIIGFFIGGFLSYLLRPSVSMIGQLPFEVVITRGSNLEGADRFLIPTAEMSSNYLIAGAILGCCIGAVLGYFIKKKKEETK